MTAGEPAPPDLTIRPPRQERSRRAWARVLDAGVEILEEGGYEAFTIAAVCERAQVAPRALYARADTKDALFLAVYEHGLARIRADQAAFADAGRWTGLPAPALVRAVTGEMARLFARHERFLRAVVLLSGAHPEVRRRGDRYVRGLADEFAALLLRAGDRITHPDPGAAARTCFGTVFAALVLRTAYGPDFAVPGTGDAALGDLAVRYLLGGDPLESPM